MQLLSVRNKILLLILGSILTVLLLVAGVFTFQLGKLYEDTARTTLTDNIIRLRGDLIARQEQLVAGARRIVSDEGMLATLNLIHRYQDTENYQAQVFDPEKGNLIARLDEVMHVAGFDMAAVYQADGQLITFRVATAEEELEGYTTYREGQPQLVSLQGERSDDATLRLYHSLGALQRAETRHGELPDIRLRHGLDGAGVLMEVTLPVSLRQGGEMPLVIGWLRLGYQLGQTYLDAMAPRLGSDIALVTDMTYLGNGTFKPEIEALAHGAIPVLQLDRPGAVDFAWVRSEEGYEAHLALSLTDGEHVHLVLAQRDGEQIANQRVFARSIFWVLLLAGVMVLPIGFYLSRRWISRPITLLTEVARGITKGDRPRVSGFDYHDEFGVLADAFVVMSGAIMQRENELREKQRQLEGIIGNAPAVIYIKDRQGCYLLINSLYERLFSVSNGELRGKDDSLLFDPHTVAQIRANEEQVFETQQPLQVEEVIAWQGVSYTYLSIKFPLFDDEGRVIAVCGISTDITARKRTETDLILAKNIIEHAHEGVVVTNLEGVITDVNEAYERISGYRREEVLGKSPAVNKSGRHDAAFYQAMWRSIHETGSWQGEIWDRRKNGAIYPKWLSINTVRDEQGKPSHYVGIFSDITLKKATEEQLERLAYYDFLTELPNRLLFRERLKQELVAARRHGGKVALLFIDLDRFKHVNDNMGHSAGDELLRIVAARLQATVRETDTVSRLGGDEFTVIIPDVVSAQDVSLVAQKIIRALGEEMRLQGQAVHIGASVGIAISPADGDDIDLLSRHADMALYKAKDEGRNNFQYFSAEMQTQIIERIHLERDLRTAIERRQFILHYQPKYDLATGEINGMESLVRWHHPERGMISPLQFIPTAEETGLIIPLSELLLRQACEQSVQWNRQGRRPLRVAVNLSARQFAQKGLPEVVRAILDETGLPAEQLELELTESMVMGDVEAAIQTMRALRDLGLSLAIDDFGTGYSSLSYLKRFPITTLKIDQSFVRDLTLDSDDASIVQAIIAMARQLDLHVVAEGVETEEQLEFLRRHGCETVQGYLLSRPLPSEEFERLLHRGDGVQHTSNCAV